MLKFLYLLLIIASLSGCMSKTPSCDGEEVKQVIRSIIFERVKSLAVVPAFGISQNEIDRAERVIMQESNFHSVVTNSLDDQIRKVSCSAQLGATTTTLTNPINYQAQRTDDGNDVLVTLEDAPTVARWMLDLEELSKMLKQ